MEERITFNGTMISRSQKYTRICIEETIQEDGSPRSDAGGMLVLLSSDITGEGHDDWVENFRDLICYFVGNGWCVKWISYPPDYSLPKERKIIRNNDSRADFKGEIISGASEFKYLWLEETFDTEGTAQCINILLSAEHQAEISTQYQVASYREVFAFLKHTGWVVLWTTHYRYLFRIRRDLGNFVISIIQPAGFFSELRDLPPGREVALKADSPQCLLLKRRAQLAVDASSETQLVVELDDLTLQQLINVLQRYLETKSKDALEFKLASRGVKISPSAIEDLSFYIAADTDY